MDIFRKDLFQDQVILITGGGTGIGRGIAQALAEHGANVALLSRSADHVEGAADEIAKSTGRRTLGLAADVREAEKVDAALARIISELGRLDAVINGAAGNFLCASADLSANGYGTVLDIDAKGTWNVSKAAFQAWFKEHGGQILSISATLHHGGTPGQLHVASAKAAVDALTRTLAVEWGPLGIRVNAIAPGPISDTEGARRLFPEAVAERIRKVIPTRALGRIEDVVNLALFTLSPAAANLNGAILVTDGGLSLTGNFSLVADALRPR